ncbi:hypothetical protein IC582_006673 [Cucumis melo]|uniref:Transcription factor bHLH49 isoform X1 n=2 Tax=Cucumis melo TaxID=3656 RepID=A0A1S3BA09_CUCME|nr:transcription factor bHLH49 isoform X1 [Cucumis melo]
MAGSTSGFQCEIMKCSFGVSSSQPLIGVDTSFSSTLGSSSTTPLCELSTASLENEGVKTISNLLHDPSTLSFDMFGSGNFSDMVGSLGFLTEADHSQIANIKCPFSYVQILDDEEMVSPKNDVKSQPDRVNENQRKFVVGSNSSSPNKNAEDNLNVATTEILNKADKTQKVEHRMSANFNTKSDSKQAKGGSQNVQSPKENYIRVQARRGRAANNHSLAERVRREKISERMKLLQQLVPGCHQITGKTVVLDEIINYVQSLQQQVEFLSMKLANVGLESSLETEQILLTNNSYLSSSNVLCKRGENVNDHRSRTFHTSPHVMFQLYGTRPTMPKTTSPSTF